MSAETITCMCNDCTHELSTDCINMHCDRCVSKDAGEMLTHKG